MEQAWEFFASKGGIVAAVFVALFILERLFPVAAWLGGIARVGKNLFLAIFNFIASPLIVIPITAFAASHAFNWRPEFWSGLAGPRA